MSLLGSFKYHKQALIMSNDADQPNSVLDEKWTHSLQNFEIYCTFIGWSLLPPFFPRPPPQKKKTYQILPENHGRRKLGEAYELHMKKRPLAQYHRYHRDRVGGSKPQALGNVVGRRISGYVKWSEFAVSAWRGWRYWLYDYMIMIFLELVGFMYFLIVGGACTLSKG